jgi:hypothetical protein
VAAEKGGSSFGLEERLFLRLGNNEGREAGNLHSVSLVYIPKAGMLLDLSARNAALLGVFLQIPLDKLSIYNKILL